MKILAAQPKSPLMGCMVDRIVDHVRQRWAPGSEDNPLSLTGPALLYQCLQVCIADGECSREGVQPLNHAYTGHLNEWELARPAPSVVSEKATRTSIAVTYRDSRNSAYPYTGMVGTDASGHEILLAFEVPKPIDFGYTSTDHYSLLAEKGTFYRDDCSLRA